MNPNRRSLTALALISACIPLTSFAQAPRKKAKVALLQPGAQASSQHLPDAVRDEMTKRGYVEGRDIEYEVVYAESDPNRFDPLAQQLVGGKPDVIISSTHSTVRALLRATRTIPIVMAASMNPVEEKLVASLARPGGTLTGITLPLEELVQKAVELGREIIPKLRHVGLMVASNAMGFMRGFDSATRTAGLTSSRYVVTRPEEIEPAFPQMKRDGVEVLVITIEPTFFNQRVLIGQLGLRHRIAVIGGTRENTAAGALLSYGASLTGLYRQAALQVDRLLKGANPSTLPVELPTVYEMILNAKTAKALGLKIPQSVLLRVDEIIE